jgi:hypothetical protein
MKSGVLIYNPEFRRRTLGSGIWRNLVFNVGKATEGRKFDVNFGGLHERHAV